MESILRAKNSAVFMLVFIPGVVLGLLLNLGLEIEFFGAYTYSYIQIIAMIPLYFWYFSIAFGLKKKLSNDIQSKLNPTMFIVGILLHILVMAYLGDVLQDMLALTNKMQGRSSYGYGSSSRLLKELLGLYGKMFLAIIGLIIALIPVAGHLAKIIKSGQTGKLESYDTAKLEFWMTILHPVGIWIIQPRINKIMNNEYDHQQELQPREISDSEDVLD